MIDCLLFDLDGTLLDTAPEFTGILNELRAERGLPPLLEKTVRPWIYLGANSMIEHCLEIDPTSPEFAAIKPFLLDHCLQKLGQHTTLFEGAESLLTWWESLGKPWGVVTNRLSAFTVPLLKSLGLDKRAGVIVSADTVGKAKPNPEPLWHACQQLNASAKRSVFVGDAPSDILAGKNAGLTTIAALYGYLPLQENPLDWKADGYIQHLNELQPYLMKLNAQTV